MKKTITLTLTLILVVLVLGCTQSNDQDTSSGSNLPAYLQEIAKEEVGTANLSSDGSYQEIELLVTGVKYHPNVIRVKKDIPLRINTYASPDAGCGREIVFPDFGINEILQPGQLKVIELIPDESGEFKFRCSMDMIRGKLIVD
jgi:plastocyanin domain-containing protein